MVRKTLLCIGLMTVLAAVPSFANTACFDWQQTQNDNEVEIDASCSSGQNLWKYNIEWGDGTSTGLTGNPVHTHTYTDTSEIEAEVTLHVYYWTEPSEVTETCWVIYGYTSWFPSTYGRCSSEY
ncbi:MAG: hypothetical protein PVG07_03515 [Acidobacteriota bacterium]|jgi:hypothetical protein